MCLDNVIVCKQKYIYFRFDEKNSKGSKSVVDGTKMVADDKIPKSTQVNQIPIDPTMELTDY